MEKVKLVNNKQRFTKVVFADKDKAYEFLAIGYEIASDDVASDDIVALSKSPTTKEIQGRGRYAKAKNLLNDIAKAFADSADLAEKLNEAIDGESNKMILSHYKKLLQKNKFITQAMLAKTY